MDTPTRLGAYGVGLIAVFAAATGLGSVVGPIGAGGTTGGHAEHGAETETETETASAEPAAGSTSPGGLQVSDAGYTLDLASDALAAGPGTPLSFRVLGPDGAPVTEYEASHDEDLHLIVVRRDMAGFQHVHPDLADDGTWSAPVDLTAGTWRVFADFVPGEGSASGRTTTLGADLAVAGDHRPVQLPAPSRTAEVDGYTVTLTGQLVPGEESPLTLSVARSGEPVTDLEPYLAAYGHLVVLRAGDLAYLHVHPEGGPGDGVTEPGPDVTFSATAPSSGDYRLFLDFQHEGVVRTAELTARAVGTAEPAGEPADQPAERPADQPTEQGAAGGHTEEGHDH